MVDHASFIFNVEENTVVLQISEFRVAFFVKQNKEMLLVAFSFQALNIFCGKQHFGFSTTKPTTKATHKRIDSTLYFKNPSLLALKDAGSRFLFVCVPVVSSSCPDLFRAKAFVVAATVTFIPVIRLFREAGSTVNRFAWSRLERNRGLITTTGAFDFKHRFF